MRCYEPKRHAPAMDLIADFMMLYYRAYFNSVTECNYNHLAFVTTG